MITVGNISFCFIHMGEVRQGSPVFGGQETNGMVGGNDSSVPRAGGQQATAQSLLFVFSLLIFCPDQLYSMILWDARRKILKLPFIIIVIEKNEKVKFN